MKKVKGWILLLVMIVVPVKVMAFEGSLSLDCTPTTIKPGEEISCILRGTSSENVNNVKANITLSNGLSVDSYVPANGWNGGDIVNNRIASYNNGNVSGSFEIGTLKLKTADDIALGKVNIGIVDIQYYLDSEESNSVSSTSSTVEIKNEEIKTGLKNLAVEGYSISPIFSLDKFGYTVIINTDTFKVIATPANDNDEVKIVDLSNPDVSLDANAIKFVPKDDNMALNIIVGDVVYNLIVTRKIDEEYDNSLKSLSVGGKRIDLVSGSNNYEIRLDDTSSYEVRATLNDSENFYIADFEDGILNRNGDGIFDIVILPKDASSGIGRRVYSITVKSSSSVNPGPSSSNDNSSHGQITNPQTGGISIFIITLILITSLIISLNLYKKNINSFK